MVANSHSSMDSSHISHRRPSKEVHFPSSSNLTADITSAAHSPHPSALHDPYFNLYEQLRTLFQQQRDRHEEDREQLLAAFAKERELWEQERRVLVERIGRLSSGKPGSPSEEFARRLSGGGSRKSSHDSAASNGLTNTKVKITATDGARLPSITEKTPAVTIALPRKLSDDTIDGVLTKKPIFQSSFDEKLIEAHLSPAIQSPTINSASPHSPSAHTPDRPSPNPNTLYVSLDDLEPKLKRDAGHTPLPRIDSNFSGSNATPLQENSAYSKPVRLAAQNLPVRPPHERADSYFPEITTTDTSEPSNNESFNVNDNDEKDEDPSLTGPLGLTSDTTQNKDFMNQLDARLLVEAKKVLGQAPPRSPSETSRDGDAGKEEEFPDLKLKKSMNFGSEYGTCRVGMR